MSGIGHGAWLMAFLFKEFLTDFVKRLAEKAADRIAKARTYIRKRGRKK